MNILKNIKQRIATSLVSQFHPDLEWGRPFFENSINQAKTMLEIKEVGDQIELFFRHRGIAYDGASNEHAKIEMLEYLEYRERELMGEKN